ncbi:unnamed protein product [Cuscuta campestris]|uniref:HAT C-terminal dimerisation domain-containing protein n=1 Tax=Cuscuta campestris TaxID=132261 RepID=A0A484MRE7_9ASTE|nr:unnamed protein product [Cuscuta campestris]
MADELQYAKIDPYFVIDFSKDKVDKVDRPPNAKDWVQAKHLMVFLEAFYNATLHLSGTSYVTSNLLFFEIVAIYKMLQNLEDIDEVIDVQDIEIGVEGEEDEVMVKNFKEMVNRMKLKFEKYYGRLEKLNTLVYIAPIFDPRYKLEGLEICVCDLFGATSGDSIMEKVKGSVDTLFDEYWQLYKPSQAQSGQSSEILNELENATSMSGQTYAQQLQKRLKGTQRARGTELQKYLNEGLEEDSEVGDDLLGWWRVHGPRYPVLARMARDILVVPVSTVASESAFSTGGRHLDAFRTSLTPKMVQALICSQDWLKTSKKIDMEETLDELKLVEKDPSSPAAPEKTVRDSNNAGEGPARAGGGDQVELGHGDGEFESPLSREFALI